MLIPSPDISVFVASQSVDMRKGCFSLAAMVQQEFELEPKSNSLFVFFGRGGVKVKILHWKAMGL